MTELAKNIRELKSILYGNSESEPVSEACAQLTQEFFRENTLRFLIFCLPQLNLEARKDAKRMAVYRVFKWLSCELYYLRSSNYGILLL
ncbi:hypothetical protein OIU78_020155 [Salix suchowensis]|nr:hypothetical protein OIU78_020155 [Salix suchowensis]KAJ6317015.1 hypothetical protein OIU78_020155 [Salix suchowensis]